MFKFVSVNETIIFNADRITHTFEWKILGDNKDVFEGLGNIGETPLSQIPVSNQGIIQHIECQLPRERNCEQSHNTN